MGDGAGDNQRRSRRLDRFLRPHRPRDRGANEQEKDEADRAGDHLGGAALNRGRGARAGFSLALAAASLGGCQGVVSLVVFGGGGHESHLYATESPTSYAWAAAIRHTGAGAGPAQPATVPAQTQEVAR